MSLTQSDRYWHAVYEALPHDVNDAIDAAFKAAASAIRDTGDCKLLTAGDDRAAHLEAAIVRYLVESNPEDAAIKAAIEGVDAP